MEAQVCFNKWFVKSMKGYRSIETSFSIPTIWVESPNLTASYYRNYLGFSLLISCPLKGSILLKNNRNWLLVKPILSNFEHKNQSLKLLSKNIKEDYSLLYDKVRVIKPYSEKSIEKFTIIDCNGIEIEYCSS